MEMKEAIEILEELQKFLKKQKTIEETKTIQKTLDEAFKAMAYTEFMKGQHSCNMSDLISRQAAIDAIRCDITITGRQNAELVAATIGAFADRIKALPSAQSEYKPVKAEDFAKTMSENTVYSFMAWYGEALELMERQGFVICKKMM